MRQQTAGLTGALPRAGAGIRGGASAPALTHRCYRSQARHFSPAGFSFAVVGRGELLLPFKAMLLSERTRGLKSGGPPLLTPSFKVQRNTAHNRNSGFAILALCDDLNAHRARKVLRGISGRGPCAGAARPAPG